MSSITSAFCELFVVRLLIAYLVFLVGLVWWSLDPWSRAAQKKMFVKTPSRDRGEVHMYEGNHKEEDLVRRLASGTVKVHRVLAIAIWVDI
jgi:hypothetical protein